MINVLSNMAGLCGGIAIITVFVGLFVWLIKTAIAAIKGN